MRRLFSTFAPGWPGAGLLLMRLVAGSAVILVAFTRLRTGPPMQSAILDVVTITAGVLLLAGLWTPITASLVALLGVWYVIAQKGDPLANILPATIGAALGLLGPGAWSVDASFGWKRIDIRDRKS